MTFELRIDKIMSHLRCVRKNLLVMDVNFDIQYSKERKYSEEKTILITKLIFNGKLRTHTTPYNFFIEQENYSNQVNVLSTLLFEDFISLFIQKSNPTLSYGAF